MKQKVPMMRRLFGPILLGCVFLASGGPVSGQGKPSDAAQEIKSLEAAEARAFLASDLPALEKLWGEEFTVNAPDNQIRVRREVLAAVGAGIFKYTRIERTVEYVAFHGDTAVAMGREVVNPSGGPDDGKTINRRYTDVWAKKGGRWVMVARHAHVVPPQ